MKCKTKAKIDYFLLSNSSEFPKRYKYISIECEAETFFPSGLLFDDYFCVYRPFFTHA